MQSSVQVRNLPVEGMRGKYSFVFAGMFFGGTTTWFGNLREAVEKCPGIESTWLPVEPHPKKWFTRIPPISMNWTLKGGLLTRSRIRAHERSGTLFHAAYFNDHMTPSFLGEFRRRVPCVIAMDVTPILMDKYGSWYGIPNSSGKSPIERIKFHHTRKTLHDAVHLLPWSNWVKESLIEDYGVSEKKITVIRPGIDMKKWSPDCRNGKREKKLRILFVGSDFRRKGGDLLTHIAQQEAFRACEFHFVTHSCEGNAPANVVTHLNVAANSEGLIELYRNADLFVLPTRADLSPIAIHEAMAMGLPVISTNLDAIKELVVNGETGYLVSPDDESALADRILSLLNDQSRRVRMGENARKIAMAEFDLHANAERVIDILRRSAVGRGTRVKSS